MAAPLHTLVHAAATEAGALLAAAAPGSRAQLDPASVPPACYTPGPAMFIAALSWAATVGNTECSIRAEDSVSLSSQACLHRASLPADLRPHLRLRYALAADAPAIVRFIRELADFEREPDAVETTEATFTADGLPPTGLEDLAALAASPPLFHVLLAELPAPLASLAAAGPPSSAAPPTGSSPRPDGAPAWVPAGMAFVHPSYSTWQGRSLYLEDLYVAPAFRRRGVSKALFTALARAATAARCARLQWSVLAWNTAAVDAYEGSMGAERLEEWRLYRLYRDGLARLGGLDLRG